MQPKNERMLRLAESLRRLGNRIEHGLHVRGRARYYIEHAGDSHLIFERLLQLACAHLLCFKQPHVLNRDHCLIGKRGEQLDLLVCKWLYGRPRYGEYANWGAFAQKGDSEHCAKTA